MADLKRLRVGWEGTGVVGPGVSTLHFTDVAVGFVPDVWDMLQILKAYIPDTVVITLPNSGETIDVATGQANGTWTDGTASSTTCTGSPNYAAGVGARIAWQTAGFNNGRRVRGSTYLVPLSAAQYDQGTIGTTPLAAMNAAVAAFITAVDGEMVVYTRPTPTVPIGATAAVVGGVIPDKVSWLRSRRT